MAHSWIPGDDLEFGRIDRGYVVRTPNMEPDVQGAPNRQANAYLANKDSARVYMWVNNVESNFAMAGVTAQSKKRRQFFPHNFVQPTLTVGGQMPNQYQHARLAEFIRSSQKECVIHDSRILTLHINGGGNDTKRELTKGRHDGIRLDGYIQNAARTAQAGENAPDFAFEFIILRARHFLGIQDDIVRQLKFKDILQIVTHPQEYQFEKGGVLDPVSHDNETGTGETINAEQNNIPGVNPVWTHPHGG